MAEKKKSEARRIYTKFEGTCKACNAPIKVGDLVTWYPGGTVYGTKCHKAPWDGKPKPKASTPKKVANPQTPSASAIPTEALEKLAQLSSLLNSPNAHKQFLKIIGKK